MSISHASLARWMTLKVKTRDPSPPGDANQDLLDERGSQDVDDEILADAFGDGAGSQYCDERLHQLVISRWTKVAVTDEFAAEVISLYLETDHPLLGLFDADLFLDNLVSGELNFCSPLLVNALLCWSCVSSDFFFFAEAPGLSICIPRPLESIEMIAPITHNFILFTPHLMLDIFMICS